MNKKGNYAGVFIFIVMAFVITIFFGIMYYGFGLMNDAFSGIQFDIGNTNFTTIVDSTWGEVYDAYDNLKILAYVLIFGMIFTIFAEAWIVNQPPIFLLFWILTSLGGIIAGAYVSNAYVLLLANADFGATLESFKGASYLLLYLPYLAGIISLVAGIIGLIGLNKSKREWGGL